VRVGPALGLAVLGLFSSSGAAGGAVQSWHVSGNRLVDAQGRPMVLHGVNRSGTEYACMQGWGIFDGPAGDASIRAIATWHVNFVRVLINEDCWLGINGVAPGLGGSVYRDSIIRYVGLLHRHGMYAEISLVWGPLGATAPPTSRALRTRTIRRWRGPAWRRRSKMIPA